MKIEREILYKIAQTPDGKIILNYYKELVTNLADVRKIEDKSPESLKGHEIACGLIEDRIIRLMEKESSTLKDADNYY